MKGNWDKLSLDRRKFVTGLLACGVASAEQLPPAVPAEEQEIAEVFLDINRIRKWDESNGDTWDPFWADDGNLYAFNCDGRGFGSKGMNLAFNRLSGDSLSNLAGTQVNEMDEYGRGGEKGPDNATWKACGQESIDGVFYAFVSRNIYGSNSKDPLMRQLATNSSLIKSTDRGRTWVRSARENFDRPMWPGPAFGAPFFIHYGRNGGQVSRDGADAFVYAVSTNGFWNDGDSLILGRVKRSHLANLNSSEWEYYAGSHGGENWSRHIESAVAILERPGKCGQTPVCYVPSLGIYLLISWYNTEPLTKWFEPNEMRYDFYQALHPWGPWKMVSSSSDRFMGPGYHMYGPSLCARFQQMQGKNVEVSLFTSGCPFENVPGTPYKLWHIPVLLRVEPLPQAQTITAAGAKIDYHGSWFPWTTIEDADQNKLPRATQTKGDRAELSFVGTGIEYIAHKTKDQGSMAVYLDGVLQQIVNLDLQNFPVFFDVVVFSDYKLVPGSHTIRIVNAGNARVNLAAFRVFA